MVLAGKTAMRTGADGELFWRGRRRAMTMAPSLGDDGASSNGRGDGDNGARIVWEADTTTRGDGFERESVGER